MSEWTSLSCKADTKERVKNHQADDEGQDDVLNRALDALESKSEADVTASVDVDTSEAMEKLDELDERIKDLNVVSNQQTLLKRIDDLETELKTHFERELRK